MKCPYACDIETVEETISERDESGNITFQQTKTVTHRKYVKCLQEECGAWQDGRCNYNQGPNGA